MKISMILFTIFMICSSVLVQQKQCSCNAMIETRIFYKGKLIKIIQTDRWQQKSALPEMNYFNGKKIVSDSLAFLPINEAE